MVMVTKTITIMDDAYEMLANKKNKGESFSEVIRRLVKPKVDIMQFAGAWKDISDKEIDDMKSTIGEMKKRSTMELHRRLKNNDLS